MDESLVMYYSIEIFRIAEILHDLGFIHADIKPDNLLLRDAVLTARFDTCFQAGQYSYQTHSDMRGSRRWKAFDWGEGDKRCGLTLVDFGRAIDTTAHPPSTMFVGDCETDDFRCVEMVQGQKWKSQVCSCDFRGEFSLTIAAYSRLISMRFVESCIAYCTEVT